MGATVGERRDGVRMREQFVGAVEVALAEVRERHPQHRSAVVLEKRIKRHRGRQTTFPSSDPRHRIRRVRLVVRRLAEGEHDVELLDQAAADSLHVLPAGRRKQPLAKCGIVQGGGAFRRREAGDFAVHRVGEERIERALEAEEHTDRPHGRLAGHGETVGAGGLDMVEDRPVVLVATG